MLSTLLEMLNNTLEYLTVLFLCFIALDVMLFFTGHSEEYRRETEAEDNIALSQERDRLEYERYIADKARIEDIMRQIDMPSSLED